MPHESKRACLGREGRAAALRERGPLQGEARYEWPGAGRGADAVLLIEVARTR